MSCFDGSYLFDFIYPCGSNKQVYGCNLTSHKWPCLWGGGRADRGGQQPRKGGARKDSYETMYDLPQGEKIQCLRNMDRTQWNHQIVSTLEEPDVTESCLHVVWHSNVLFFGVPYSHWMPHAFLSPLSSTTKNANKIRTRLEEILAVLAMIDPMERPPISMDKHGGGLGQGGNKTISYF